MRLLVEVTSTLYFYRSQASHADSKSTRMWGLLLFPATQVLHKLGQALGNALLAAATLEKLTSLFLVLFDSVTSVGYTKLRSPVQNASAPTPGMLAHQSRTSSKFCTSSPPALVFGEAQERLLRRLAHRMVYIAGKINPLVSTISRNHVIECSACR